jgi:hypothetical protein
MISNGATAHPQNTEGNEAEQEQDEYDHLFGAEQDSFDAPTTTRKELWSYYLYYNGE